ncbi:MAG: ABC transporter permease [Planctomycetota bacterium]|nr:ABC transporter permease [Planctomycetota bacterium]
MVRILVIARKDLQLLLRDPLGLFFILAFPAIMGIIFGAITGSFQTDQAVLEIAVIDEDQSRLSSRFTSALVETGSIRIWNRDAVLENERQASLDRVRRGRLTAVVILPTGFGETAGIPWASPVPIAVAIDPSRTAERGMLQGLLVEAAGSLVTARLEDPESRRILFANGRREMERSEMLPTVTRGLLVRLLDLLEREVELELERANSSNPTAPSKSTFPVELEFARIEFVPIDRQADRGLGANWHNKVRSRWDLSFPQGMLWGVLSCSAGFAISLVREQEQGTFLRLQVAPLSRFQILAGKAAACFVTVLFVILAMVLLGYALGMRPTSPLLLALAAFSIACSFVGIMLAMSVTGRTAESVNGAAWGSGVLMAMFGGGMVPLVFMPEFMQTLSLFSPVRWAVEALEGAIWRNYSAVEMLRPCGVLMGIGAIGFCVGILVLKRRTG